MYSEYPAIAVDAGDTQVMAIDEIAHTHDLVAGHARRLKSRPHSFLD
jgi:hypothetical protein